jgi:hypothetical protein
LGCLLRIVPPNTHQNFFVREAERILHIIPLSKQVV